MKNPRLFVLVGTLLLGRLSALCADEVAFAPAFAETDIAYDQCRTFRDGQAAPVDPARVRTALGFLPADTNTESSAKWEGGEASSAAGRAIVFDYLVALKRPVAVGTLCVDPADEQYKGSKNNGELWYLKAGIWPPDPARTDQWAHATFAPAAPMTRFAVLPPGMRSQAFLYRDVRVAGLSRVEHWRVFGRRLQNITAAAASCVSGGAKSRDAENLVTGLAWDTTVGTKDGAISSSNPAWCVLDWSAPRSLQGVFLRSNVRSLQLESYVGDPAGDPAAAPDADWKPIVPAVSDTSLHDFTYYAYSWRWISLPTTTTRALRLKLLGLERQANGLWINGLGVFTDLQEAPAVAILPRDTRPPFRFHYTIPADGQTALVLDNGAGLRVKNLFAEVDRPSGPAEEAWDLKDSAGHYVEPGTYRLRGIVGPPLELRYQLTPYPNVDQLWRDRTPWMQGHSGPHGWLSDHCGNWAVATVGDRVYFGSPMAEAGVCLIACDLTGKKLWGKHDMGAWLGIGQMAGDGKVLFIAASDDQLYRLEPASNTITRIGRVFERPDRRGFFSCMAAHDGRVYLGFTGEQFLDNAFSDGQVDVDACLPKPPSADDFLRALRVRGHPPGQNADPNAAAPQGNGRLDLESTSGPGPVQATVIAFREPVPIGSLVFPVPAGTNRLSLSVLKPTAPYPPRPSEESDWIPFSTAALTPGWTCLPAPPDTRTRAIRIAYTRSLRAAGSVDDDVTNLLRGDGKPARKEAGWFGRIEGLRVLRRRFENVAPSAQVRVNSGVVAADGSWDARRTTALGPENPGTYVLEWRAPQKLSGLAIKEIDGAVTEVDVWQGPAAGSVPLDGEALDRLSTATGWRHVATYKQPRRSAYYPSADLNKFARYLDGVVEFENEVETRAVRLRVVRQWMDHGDRSAECRKHDGRSEHGLHYTQSYAAALDTRLCRIEGVAALRAVGGEPAVDRMTYQRVEVRDGQTGARLRELPAEVGWHGLACGPDGALYANNRRHTGIDRIDTETGRQTPVVSGIEPSIMTVGPDNRIYVFPWTGNGREAIQVYDLTGHLVRTIGKPGGWTAGAWDPERFGQVFRLCVDRAGSLWVLESGDYPRRIVQYDTRDGRLVKEIFGNTMYGGGGGGTLDRYDPTRLWYGRVEFGRDPAAHTSHVRGLLADGLDNADIVAVRVPGRHETYLATAPLSMNDRQAHGVVYVYDEAAGTARPAAAVGNAEFFAPLRGSAIISKLNGAVPQGFIFMWSDANGDGRVDADEVTFLPKPKGFAGVGRFDDALGCTGGGIQFRVREFRPNGAPVYEQVAVPGNPHLRLADGNFFTVGGSFAEGAPSENFVTDPQGRKLWGWGAGLGMSGLSIAPWVPGTAGNQFSIIGHETAPVGDLGEFVVIHANTGEWNVWTADGLLAGQVLLHKGNPLSKLFGPPEVQPGLRLDPLSAGQEHFHGFFTRTEPDNRYYIIAGFTHMSLIEVAGLDRYRRFATEVKVTEADLAAARAWETSRTQRRAATPSRVLHARRLEMPPEIDGQRAPHEWGRSETTPLNAAGAATLSVGYDRANLYLCWTLRGLGVLRNSGTEFQRLFKTGAALDLHLSTDPAADPKRTVPARGDLRLLITFVSDPAKPGAGAKPQVVLYQPVAPGARPGEGWRTRTAAGGETAFDRVVLLPTARVAASGSGDPQTIEAAVPLRDLGLTIREGLKLKLDWGVLSSSDGNQVKQRLYWANEAATGTSDEAIEARLEPASWGAVVFEDGGNDDDVIKSLGKP